MLLVAAMKSLLAALVLAGCAVTYGDSPKAITSGTPAFTPVGDGVEAALDSPDPLFFVDGSYYLFRDGVWLSSKSVTGGFHYVAHLPGQLLEIERPKEYANLHVRHHAP